MHIGVKRNPRFEFTFIEKGWWIMIGWSLGVGEFVKNNYVGG